MLTYEPEKRATAQDMLESPWLKMEANFEYKMTDREHEKLKMINKYKQEKKTNNNERDVIESENELNMADDEDNDDILLQDEDLEDNESYMEPTETINIQNFNNSFAVYGQHVKLSALDKANPQFAK